MEKYQGEITVPDVGTFKRDSNGEWCRVDKLGRRFPVAPAFRAVLDLYDQRALQDQVKEAGYKLSPGVPDLWAGPLPGDKSRSWSSSINCPLAPAETVVQNFTTSGWLLVKSIYLFNTQFIGGVYPNAALGTYLRIRCYRENNLEFEIEAPNIGPIQDVFWIVGPGEIEFRIQNLWIAAVFMSGATCWERIAARPMD